MLRGINRQNIFYDDEDYQRFVQVLYQMVYPTDELTGGPLPAHCVIYAYCLMSNHVHLLVRETSESLASVIKRIGVTYAQFFNKKYTRYGHLFQDRYRSEPVNDSAYFFTLLQYIHQNPVAAGLSTDVASYRWSSWKEYEMAEAGVPKICNTSHVLKRMPIDDLRELVNTLLPETESILDYDCGSSFKTDKEVIDFISARFGVTPTNIQHLNRDTQNEILCHSKAFGATIRQLVRLTGIGYSIVQRA